MSETDYSEYEKRIDKIKESRSGTSELMALGLSEKESNRELLRRIWHITRTEGVLTDDERTYLADLLTHCVFLDSSGFDIFDEGKKVANEKNLQNAKSRAVFSFQRALMSREPGLANNWAKAESTGEYYVYYSINLIAGLNECTIYQAQKQFAEYTKRTFENVKSQYHVQKKMLGIK